VSSLLFVPKVVFVTAGTFCSIELSALALSPPCSFLKIQKKTFLNKRTVSQASDVVAFVSAV
jgi:hypothetical protein